MNGKWLGIALAPVELYNHVKTLKYKGIIHIYTSVVFDYTNKIIYINNDAGRLMRPVYKVKNNKILLRREHIEQIRNSTLSWNDLVLSCRVDESIIEYIYNE